MKEQYAHHCGQHLLCKYANLAADYGTVGKLRQGSVTISLRALTIPFTACYERGLISIMNNTRRRNMGISLLAQICVHTHMAGETWEGRMKRDTGKADLEVVPPRTITQQSDTVSSGCSPGALYVA